MKAAFYLLYIFRFLFGLSIQLANISMLNLNSADHKQYCHLIDTLTALLGLM